MGSSTTYIACITFLYIGLIDLAYSTKEITTNNSNQEERKLNLFTLLSSTDSFDVKRVAAATATARARPTKPVKVPIRPPTNQPVPVRRKPTKAPTRAPVRPSINPTQRPVLKPTNVPVLQNTNLPTNRSPLLKVTNGPTRKPTSKPSTKPTTLPTRKPTRIPTSIPLRLPVSNPTRGPTRQPVSTPISSLVSYDITFHMQGDGLIASDVAIFESAGKRWSELVVGDLPMATSSGLELPIANCIAPASIDDLHICGSISYIDGAYNVLGYAGPYWLRGGSSLPFIGQMVFDSADVVNMRSSGSLSGVILHEMGHVLGIGTLWEAKGVTGLAANNCPYQGPNGNREYRTVSECATATLPTEQNGGQGTRCGHFSESCFKDELMTGYATGAMPISRLTVATLEDLGYNVSYTKANNFTKAQMGPTCVCTNRNLREGELKIVKPIGFKDEKGSQKKRKLSKDGYKIAREFGIGILKRGQKREEKMNLLAKRSGSRRRKSNAIFVGSDIISVLYDDGPNGVFGVIVTKYDI